MEENINPNDKNCAVVPAMVLDTNSATYSETNDNTSGFGGEEPANITYVLNGGIQNSSNVSKYIIGVGVPSFADPVRTSYAFEGWYSDSAFTKRVTSISKNETEDITLYAKWRSTKVANIISLPKTDIRIALKTKAQSISLGASAKGAKLKYVSGNSKVTVDANGNVTIPKKFIGIVTITITSEENESYYSATKTVTITVTPAKCKFSSAKNTVKGQVKLTWKADKTVTGYEIKYEIKNKGSKKFKKAKTIKIKKNKTKVYTLKKLKKGSTVKVSIRTYKKVGKDVIYSDYSKAKSIKIKK